MEKLVGHRASFTFMPLERGYGETLGNALRRVLIASLEGYAITSIKIPGVQHEFSTLRGVREDLVEMVLNLKQVRLQGVKENISSTQHIAVKFKGKEVFKAGDLEAYTSDFKVANPDLTLCHLDTDVELEIDMTVSLGRGYVPADEHKPEQPVLGLIPIDAIFTPIINVKCAVDYVRVEQKTDYERLKLEIHTDGTIRPEKALEQAANILTQHISLCTQGHIVVETPSSQALVLDQKTLSIRQLLKTPISTFDLPSRATNSLKTAGIHKLGDLVSRKESDITGIRNFGSKSLEDLRNIMKEKGLSFGMDVSQYALEGHNDFHPQVL